MAKVHSILKTKAANGELQEHLLATTTALIEDAGQPGGVATLNAIGVLKQMPTLPQVGGVRQNLFKNAHRSINQMGKMSATSTSWHLPDRWICFFAPGTVGQFDLLPDGNLRMTKTSGDFMLVSQRFERTFWDRLIGKVVTVSVLVGTDLLTASFTVAASGYQAFELLGGSYNIGIDTLAEYGYVQLVLFSNITSAPISPMKLELGEGQTLAHKDANGNWMLIDPPPNPQQELAKCQEKLFVADNYIPCSVDYVSAAQRILFHFTFPVVMKGLPTFSGCYLLNPFTGVRHNVTAFGGVLGASRYSPIGLYNVTLDTPASDGPYRFYFIAEVPD